ncbi:manganese efflux pump MntP family protein [Ruminococcus sp. Marseille-P6503]|uniref:manganese efflux pump MntP n=1 Tax=Ruminococcus sp. Marseille-P6503 TaxID=2364796 RepID=UPI000F5478FC|nr:manganese efflux pump MntP family protein [Ruminococcus sp. Marseille-P6503]
MGIAELFILAAGLSMDAFAVSVCKGLALKNVRAAHMLLAGLWFGGFQALMPAIGYFLGVSFSEKIQQFDHWIAFVLLCFIGANMIKESVSGSADGADASMKPKNMFLLAVATSIDALAVGVTFAFLKISIAPAVSLIGAVTFAFSALGIKIGSIFGTKYKSKAELAGGVILILLGAKILIEHLFLS